MSGGGQRIAIVGGGPAGSLLAILLARRGFTPFVIERSPRFSPTAPRGGRSINLALAARGIAALRRAGIDADVAKLMIPMRGRMLHDLDGEQAVPVVRPTRDEEIYSVSRAALNTLLYELAAQRHGVEYRFGEQCVGIDRDGTPLVESRDGVRQRSRPTSFLRPTARLRGAALARRRRRHRAPRSCSITATRSSRSAARATAISRSIRMRCTSGRAAASC